MAGVCCGMEMRSWVEVETFSPTGRRGRACARYISNGARYAIEEKCVQIGRARCNAPHGVLALQPGHRKNLQLIKVREATGCKWHSSILHSSESRIRRGFEPTTDLGIGNARLGPTHEL